MITRLRAKMATNENSEGNNTIAGHSQNRARGPSNGSEMNFAMLMEFIKNQYEGTRKRRERLN